MNWPPKFGGVNFTELNSDISDACLTHCNFRLDALEV